MGLICLPWLDGSAISEEAGSHATKLTIPSSHHGPPCGAGTARSRHQHNGRTDSVFGVIDAPARFFDHRLKPYSQIGREIRAPGPIPLVRTQDGAIRCRCRPGLLPQLGDLAMQGGEHYRHLTKADDLKRQGPFIRPVKGAYPSPTRKMAGFCTAIGPMPARVSIKLVSPASGARCAGAQSPWSRSPSQALLQEILAAAGSGPLLRYSGRYDRCVAGWQ
jgi:hypothetical protein